MYRQVILLGKTGNGKSSTGNSITKKCAFKSDGGLNSVTLRCEVHTSMLENGRDFKVCDTPGLFCVNEDPIEIALEIQKSVELCQNPHAFLLVFNGDSRMTSEEKYTIDLLRVIFGDKMFDHCIVVITRGNKFKKESMFNDYWTKNLEMKKIVETCGNRVVKIENDTECPANSELGGLLEMIETLANNGSYEGRFLKTHAEVLEEYKLTYGVSKSEEIDKHLHAVLNTLERRLEREKKIIEEEKRRAEEESKRLAKLKRKAELEENRLKEEKRRAEEESKIMAKLKREAELEEKRLKEEKRRTEEESKRLAKLKKEISEKKQEEDKKQANERQKVSMAQKEISRKNQDEEKRLAKERQILSENQRQIDEERRLIETEKEETRETQKTIKTVATVAAGVNCGYRRSWDCCTGCRRCCFRCCGCCRCTSCCWNKKFFR